MTISNVILNTLLEKREKVERKKKGGEKETWVDYSSFDYGNEQEPGSCFAFSCLHKTISLWFYSGWWYNVRLALYYYYFC